MTLTVALVSVALAASSDEPAPETVTVAFLELPVPGQRPPEGPFPLAARWTALGFHVPVETVLVDQDDLDRSLGDTNRRRRLSLAPGVMLTGPRARIADTPLSDANVYLDGVRIDPH
jgi:hypothetical protein